jgi:hypothetical protein
VRGWHSNAKKCTHVSQLRCSVALAWQTSMGRRANASRQFTCGTAASMSRSSVANLRRRSA